MAYVGKIGLYFFVFESILPLHLWKPKPNIMKTSILKSITIICLLFISGALFSQDKIYKKDKDVIICKISAISDDAITYTTDETGTVEFSIKTTKVEKVVFESGKEIVYNDEKTGVNSSADYGGNKKGAVKVDMFAPFLGVFAVGYEHSIKPGRSWEVEVGIIGLGVNIDNQNAAGLSLKGGYKLISRRVKEGKTPHLLRGFYFRPEVNFAAFGADLKTETSNSGGYYGYSTTTYKREAVVSGAFIMTVGAQTVMNNSFLIDGYLGLGYGASNTGGSYSYRFLHGPSNFPLAFTWGLKMGFLTK